MKPLLACLCVAALAALAVVAIASGRGAGSATFCAQGDTGQLSLAKGGKCPDGARKLSLAKEGPRGKAGAPGPAGATGAAGPDVSAAALAPEPVRFVQDRSQTTVGGCFSAPGTFCSYYLPEQGYDNGGGGFAKVGYFKDSSGFVHLQGATAFVCTTSGCQGTPYAYTTVFYLPPGYRPLDGTREFAIGRCAEGPIRTVQIDTNGAVTLSSPSCALDSLDGISFHP